MRVCHSGGVAGDDDGHVLLGNATQPMMLPVVVMVVVMGPVVVSVLCLRVVMAQGLPKGIVMV